ncbi:MAG: hypothetical protein KAR35_07395 [Candidatus Heimdallarchaeota archaeon]|nr:hypothetical protein [Candidatus Heimdallarchaeota archaeon]MCK5049185.1 hypothetical protein [Candidatus Heimdallarchaeota archaeon]
MIKSVLVQTTYGQIFFSKQFVDAEEEFDVSLTGGLISAIYGMTSETQREKITDMDLENNRIIFREAKNDLLFVLTVDKRMDTADADELIDTMRDRFFEKYGDLAIDGLILSDFEPVVDEVLASKLWYMDAPKKFTLSDAFTTLFAMFCTVWYTMLFLEFNRWVVDPLSSSAGGWSFVGSFILIIAYFAVPLIILSFSIYYTKAVSSYFHFMSDYLVRPTRSAYTDFLEWHFMSLSLLIGTLAVTISYFGKAFLSEFATTAITQRERDYYGANLGDAFRLEFLNITAFSVITWLFLYPLIFYLIFKVLYRDQIEKELIKNLVIISSMSMSVLVIQLFIGGTIFLEAAGFHPEDLTIWRREVAISIEYVFFVSILLNIGFFGFLFFLGIGSSRLVKVKTELFPLIFGVAVLGVLIVQKLFFYIYWNIFPWSI